MRRCPDMGIRIRRHVLGHHYCSSDWAAQSDSENSSYTRANQEVAGEAVLRDEADGKGTCRISELSYLDKGRVEA